MKSISKSLIIFVAFLLLMLSFGTAAYAEGENTGSIVRVSEDIYVNEGYNVSGDVVTVKGNIYINGTVTGNAVSVFGNIIVNNGTVTGDAVSALGKVTVGQKGKVLGKTVEALGGTYSNRNGFNPNFIPRIFTNPLNRTASVVSSFFGSLVLFMFAAIVYAIIPKKSDAMAGTIEPNAGRRLGIGVLTLIGSPIAMIIISVVLAITIIGILVIPFLWVAYLAAFLVAIVPVYIFIGRKVLGLAGNKAPSGFAGLAAGIFTLWVIKAASALGGWVTGFINGLISFLVLCLGLGSLIDYIITNRKGKKAEAKNFPQGEGEYNVASSHGQNPDGDNQGTPSDK